MSNLVFGGGAPSAAYTIDQSLRFERTDSSYFNRTPGSSGDRKTFTISCWIKRGIFNYNVVIASAGNSVSSDPQTSFFISNDRQLRFASHGGTGFNLTSDAVYRDPSAWYHFVAAIDTTQSVEANRGKFYVNGELITVTGTYPAQDAVTDFNYSSAAQYIGVYVDHGVLQTAYYYDGYLAELYLIDGTQYAASDFGETSSTTNQWIPKDASGLTFGTNGYYFKFQDSAALGDDSSGNGNDYTVNNQAATNQMLDSPTANYSTMNPLDANASHTPPTFSEGNLKVITAGGNFSQCCGTFGMSSGKWGFKYTHTSGSTDPNGEMVGITKLSRTINSDYLHNQSAAYLYYAASGNKYNGSDGGSFGSSLATDDYLEFLLDTVGGTLKVKKNGTLIGTMYSGLSDETYLPCFDSNSANDFGGEFDFGQSGYEPSDTDYSTLCTSSLPDPEIALPGENFNTVLYTGNGTSLAVTGVGFQPDMVTVKSRSDGTSNYCYDSIRGAGERMVWDGTYSESSISGVTSFDSDGFTVGTETGNNLDGGSFVSWSWLGASSNAANSEGNISSVVRANTAAGFSIVSYTGDDQPSATIGHGLSAAPELVIIKSRDSAEGWYVGSSEGSMSFTSSDYLTLNTTGGESSSDTIWDDTAPTATVFTVGTNDAVNAYDDYIAYCFHSIEGYSKVGGYTGTGNSDGPFMHLSFRPAFVMWKVLSASDSWAIMDDKMNAYNPEDTHLRPNASDAARTDAGKIVDYVANGFKIRMTDGQWNTDGGTYLYYAVAAYPFKYSPAR